MDFKKWGCRKLWPQCSVYENRTLMNNFLKGKNDFLMDVPRYFVTRVLFQFFSGGNLSSFSVFSTPNFQLDAIVNDNEATSFSLNCHYNNYLSLFHRHLQINYIYFLRAHYIIYIIL